MDKAKDQVHSQACVAERDAWALRAAGVPTQDGWGAGAPNRLRERAMRKRPFQVRHVLG
jgi:hypothetical protein